MKRLKLISILTIIAMIAVLFSGCGKKEDKIQISGTGDIAGLTIAVQQGTIGNDLADEIADENSDTNVIRFTKYVDAITALKQMKADAVIMDNAPAEYFVKQNDDLMILSEELTTEEYAIAINLENVALLEAVNSALSQMREDGTLDAIILKYQTDMSQVESVDLNTGAEGGKLIMGTETGFAPYEYKQGDQILGIDVEIAAYIAKSMDKELVITDMDFDALIPALVTNKIDFIAAGMTVTEERKENVNFSDPYIDAKQVVVIRKSSFAG